MPLLSVLPIIVPLLGAGGTLASSLVPGVRRYSRYITLAATGIALILILVLGWTSPMTTVLSLWQPSYLFGSMPVLRAEPATQVLALLLAVATFSALLLDLGRGEKAPTRLAAIMLALLAPGIAVLWSANTLTMIVSWAAFDLLYAYGRAAAGRPGRDVVRGLALGNLATLFLWGGALLSEENGALTRLWPLIGSNDAQLTLWALAGAIRLALYPLHLSVPDELSSVSTAAAPLLLQQPILGWGLWLRIVSVNGNRLPDFAWIPLLAAITMALGGLLAWTRESHFRLMPWASMGLSGAILLASSMAGQRAPGIMVAGCVSWALSSLVLMAGSGWHSKRWWWSVPALMGALAFIGLPLTLGFVAQSALVGGLARGERLYGAICFFVGQLFLIPALVRLMSSAPAHPSPDGLWERIVQGVALGLPALWLAVLGIVPLWLLSGQPGFAVAELFSTPTLPGWLLWAVALVLGGLLAWQERNLRPKVSFLLGAIHDLLRLEWLYDAVMGAADRGLAVLRTADEIVGGAGALLWSWVLFLAVLLVIGS